MSVRVSISTVAASVLLISTCITACYFALLHSDTIVEGRGAPHRTLVKSFRTIKERLRGGVDPCVGVKDENKECRKWALDGECAKNPEYMLQACRRSCNSTCTTVPSGFFSDCKDQSSYCGQWAAVGECDSNPNYMKHQCRVTCHLCQSEECHDANVSRCKEEAAQGLCRTEPERMYRECRWACRWCAMSTSSRCRRAQDQQPAAWPGSLERMFARTVDEELHARFAPRVLSRSPWVVSFDSFLSDAECDAVIAVAGNRFARSVAGDGVQPVRTSSTAWCSFGACQRDPVMTAIRARIANLTMVPARNAEHMQVLRYEAGQFYKVHHDQNSPQTSAWGPRLYTFFMYLNDVDEGGQTHFPRLNISVRPKRGRALLWPSVLDHDPNARDDRTEHESVAVGSGTKYAANYWLHMYDFEEPTRYGCGNTEVFGNW